MIIVSFIIYITWIRVTQKAYLPKIDFSENMFGYCCAGWHTREEKKYCCIVENIVVLYKRNQILRLEKGNQINISILPVPSSLQWMGPQQDLGPKQCLPVFNY